MKPSVLVTRRVYPEAIAYLRDSCEVEYVESDGILTREEMLARASDKAAILSQLTDRFDGSLFEQLPHLKVLANVAVGFDNIDVAAATAAGVLVTNTPDVLTETTADFAWTLLMASARRLVEGHHFVHSGQWKVWSIDLLVGQDIFGRTLGIFGMGRIGQAFARRAKGFNMRLLYSDVARAPEAVERELGLSYVSKEELLRESDFVSLHVPLLAETRRMMGQAEFRLMKKTAILVNTSRGPVVDEAALVEGLETGEIGGAGLDVFESEPRVHPRLLELPNATLAPHIASASVDTRRRMSTMAAENAVAALKGQRPPNLVNPELWQRSTFRKDV